jgi:hypothetical protein
MIDTREPAVLSSMFSDACTVLPDISAIAGALQAPALSCLSAQCRICISDQRGYHRAGYLYARGALHAHGTRAMKDVAILELR